MDDITKHPFFDVDLSEKTVKYYKPFDENILKDAIKQYPFHSKLVKDAYSKMHDSYMAKKCEFFHNAYGFYDKLGIKLLTLPELKVYLF